MRNEELFLPPSSSLLKTFSYIVLDDASFDSFYDGFSDIALLIKSFSFYDSTQKTETHPFLSYLCLVIKQQYILRDENVFIIEQQENMEKRIFRNTNLLCKKKFIIYLETCKISVEEIYDFHENFPSQIFYKF
jgi:hypothetical protein